MATTWPRGPREAPPTQPQTPVSPKKRLDKGVWRDGDWWCNCSPRQKAALRETKRAGPNKGKLYFRCNKCDFFLWWDQAKVRMDGLVPAAESPKQRKPSFVQRPLTEFGYQVTPGRHGAEELTDSSDEATEKRAEPKAVGMETPCPPWTKRKRDALQEDHDDDDEFGAVDSDEERQMAAIADQSAQKLKAAVTPSAQRTVHVVDGLPTPSVTRTLFPRPGTSKRQKQVPLQERPSSATAPATTSSTVTTPPSSPGDADGDADADAGGDDVGDNVMALLRGQAIDAKVLESVQKALATAARRTRGVARGRDTARAALKERDARMARLQERIAALENKEKMHQAQMTNIKASLMKMYEDN